LNGYGVRTNPARGLLFDRCVKAVRARGSARDPRAVCAVAGRKKYGQAEMTRRAKAGRRRGRAKRNPADAAVENFREFHGREPDSTVRVERTRHHHEWLTGAGRLKFMVVIGVDSTPAKTIRHKISKLDGALLAFNEQKNQLFVEGGDQSLNLDDYGITAPHEIETIGRVDDIAYFADKHHPGPDFGEGLYVHKFRTTNENGEHVTVAIARWPDLIYRVRDQQFEFSGGSYTIRAEGIDL
jgi:hypothetical protein